MAGMSDLSPDPSGRSPGERWPLPSVFEEAGDGALRQFLLLERCFDGPGTRWSDALVTRMRRHIGGCMAAVEMMLRLELEARLPSGSPAVQALPESVGWAAIQRRPALLGPDLTRHFRDRAGISLILQDEPPGVAAANGSGAESLFSAAAADTLSMLALAQAGWNDSNPDTAPMRADLSAEAMEQLVWLQAALIADALGRSGLLEVADLLELADRAARAVLARHDEQSGPFALAALLAHQTRDHMDEERLVWLARHGQMLALIAVMADRVGVECEALVRTIVEGQEQALFRLCRAADFPREVAVRLVLGRRCISRGVEDSELVHYADEYERMTRADAARAVVPLRMNAFFQDRLFALRDRGLADER